MLLARLLVDTVRMIFFQVRLGKLTSLLGVTILEALQHAC